MNTPATERNDASTRRLAIVTGASSGIGYELARCCAEDGFDLIIAADDARIEECARSLRECGVDVQALQVDLAALAGVERVVAAAAGRPVDALLANAGHGLGKAFLDQELDDQRHVLDTNVTGTVALVHKVGRDMRTRGNGRILVTGSVAGFMPGSYHAVYNATKAFLDSFSYALRDELRDSGVTVTCLMPGPTDTEFFARADMLDTQYAAGSKASAEQVARAGFHAMMQGKPAIVTGVRNKMQAAMTTVVPGTALARMHARRAAPGSAQIDRRAKAAVIAAFGGLAVLAAVWLLARTRTRVPGWQRWGQSLGEGLQSVGHGLGHNLRLRRGFGDALRHRLVH